MDSLKIVDLRTFKVISKVINETLPVYRIYFSYDDKCVFIGGNSGLSYYNIETNETKKVFKNAVFEDFISPNQYNNYIYWNSWHRFVTKLTFNITSISDEEKDSNISISPNPTSDFINIVGVEPETRLELTNILGDTVWSGLGVKQISTQELPNGTYFLKITKGSQVKSQKVLVWR